MRGSSSGIPSEKGRGPDPNAEAMRRAQKEEIANLSSRRASSIRDLSSHSSISHFPENVPIKPQRPTDSYEIGPREKKEGPTHRRSDETGPKKEEILSFVKGPRIHKPRS